ncbi:hypothetical protein RN001_010862 [Aquatica leii]|uniref:Potassium channel domain-containing protein n=1 Tax=Aquatica leii TaxID=1421715 RepID=A0AAN7S8Q8_9COLE|nr:hypothetical protein RN001_010862 [Aquatica leii]
MAKDTGHYHYDSYPIVSKQNNAVISNSLKRDTSKPRKPDEITSCKCFGTKKSKRKAFVTGLVTNLGICVLLFGYTLIGSIVFLTIEGGESIQQQTLATISNINKHKRILNNSLEIKAKTDEARARTVETIWDITVNLNILYRDNWTKLASQEINKFQKEIIKSLEEELSHTYVIPERKSTNKYPQEFQWTFAKAFLYSLTVLTTIGYGSIAPRTTLGKAVTIGYAILGIPLTLLYLSSVGSILSRIARGVFSRALCCCLCSNCGYCCYDEKRMAEKEKKMKRKRQQKELQQQLALQEPFYVRANPTITQNATHNNLHSPVKDESMSEADNESKASMHGLSILAPVLLCLIIMFIYICLGTFALYNLQNWSVLDGFYFCFMSLTTIGFGDMVPGFEIYNQSYSEITVWFCSLYIMSGMALTAMCFSVVHDEIIHRLRHQERNFRNLNSDSCLDDFNSVDPYNLPS